MSVDTVVMALRNAVAIDKDGINHIADLLEQLLDRNERLRSENERLKELAKLAKQSIARNCDSCIHSHCDPDWDCEYEEYVGCLCNGYAWEYENKAKELGVKI